MVSEIQAIQTSARRPPAHPDTMGENNTPTALNGLSYGFRDIFNVLFSAKIQDDRQKW